MHASKKFHFNSAFSILKGGYRCMYINGDKEYKEDEYIHFVREFTGVTREIDDKKSKSGKRRYKEYDMREIPFDDIISLNLNKSGESIPFSNNGVINVNRYLFWFWTPIIGSDCISLYILLSEYCNDETDICYPKESELADRLGLSKRTIQRKIPILEENNFLLVINRLNRLANNKETSPIYKMRQTIPLLSREQYHQLPDYLKKKHDKFMDRYGRDSHMEAFLYDSGNTISGLLSNSERVVTKREREQIDNILKNSQQSEYIVARLSSERKVFQESFYEVVLANWSKPVFDTAFDKSIVVVNEEELYADLILTEVGKEMCESIPSYKKRLLEVTSELYGDNVEDMNFYTFKEYIIAMKRG
jgi:hypothetical protein